jgi:cell division septation protein DedD
MPEQQQDTEIILGTGKLLAIFFGLTAVCGIFFGLGYSVGRSSGPMMLPSGPTTVVSGPGAKPGAGVTVATSAAAAETTASPVTTTAATPSAPNLSSSDTTASQQNAPDTTGVKPEINPPTAADQTVAKTTAAPELEGNAATITVQVAAVTKQEDAEALAAALRKKNYPVFVSPNASTDNLYHVQVGPFSELKDAEAMKGKLAGDGYNAIVKR